MPPLELLRASQKWISLKSNWESPGPRETLLKKSGEEAWVVVTSV